MTQKLRLRLFVLSVYLEKQTTHTVELTEQYTDDGLV